MKKLVTRIRNAGPRRIAIIAAAVAVTYGVLFGMAHLVGLAIDHNPNFYSVNDAATASFLLGFASSFGIVGLGRSAEKALTARFGRKPADAAQ